MSYSSARQPFVLVLSALVPLAVVAPLTLPASAASCPAISLDTVSLGSTTPGNTVVLSGDGYCAPAENFFAWGTDGTRGFGFTVEGTNQTQMLARLNDTHAPVTGTLRLWFGQRIPLPDRVLELETGIYHLHDASLLLPLEATAGPVFSAQAGTSTGYTSELINGELWIDFGPSSSLRSGTPEELIDPSASLINETAPLIKNTKSENQISVMVSATTNGSPGGGSGGCGPDEDPLQGTPPNRWVHIFEMNCYGYSSGCQGSLAGTVSGALGSTLSSMGMAVRTEGSSVVVSHCAGEIDAGFATITTTGF